MHRSCAVREDTDGEHGAPKDGVCPDKVSEGGLAAGSARRRKQLHAGRLQPLPLRPQPLPQQPVGRYKLQPMGSTCTTFSVHAPYHDGSECFQTAQSSLPGEKELANDSMKMQSRPVICSSLTMIDRRCTVCKESVLELRFATLSRPRSALCAQLLPQGSGGGEQLMIRE